MPYMLEGKCVYKKNSDGSKGKSMGCSDSVEMAKKHLKALYAAENKSFAELSMTITKASIPDKKNRTMRLSLVNSDTSEDAYGEKMSVELFEDFVRRIKDEEDVPAPFDDVVCEEEWCGGLPYLSISHYKSGGGSNVPGEVENVYVDGERLKSTAVLYDNSLGNAVWKSVCEDLEERNKPTAERTHQNPVRVSIGFLDLQHKHVIEGEEDYIFTRTELKQLCPKCAEGVGGKIYTKGQLVHKAFTRVPANGNTSVEVLRMGEEEIKTRKDDAQSIIGELADELVGKSVVDDALVVKDETEQEEVRDEEPKEEIEQVLPENLEVTVEETKTIIQEPVVDKSEHMNGDCPEGDEDCKKKMAKKEAPAKSKVETTVETLMATLSAVKAKSATKEQLQPILNELVNNLNEETADPQEAMMEQMRSIFREELDAKINALRPELVQEVLKSIPATVQAKVPTQEIPQPRSILVKRQAPVEQAQELTQIQKIALRSVGQQV